MEYSICNIIVRATGSVFKTYTYISTFCTNTFNFLHQAAKEVGKLVLGWTKVCRTYNFILYTRTIERFRNYKHESELIELFTQLHI